MKIYISSDAPYARHHVTPAADREFHSAEKYGESGFPASWMDAKKEPLTFVVEFRNGEAEVENSIGKYMLDRGIATKSKLKNQMRRLYDSLGNVVMVQS